LTIFNFVFLYIKKIAPAILNFFCVFAWETYLLIPIFCQGQLKRKKRNISKAKNKNYSEVGYLVASVKMNFNKFLFVPM
jgi:hypothetical protein